MTTQPASLPRSISLQEIDMFSAPPVQKVSVVIPVYNEQESLPELIRRTTAEYCLISRSLRLPKIFLSRPEIIGEICVHEKR